MGFQSPLLFVGEIGESAYLSPKVFYIRIPALLFTDLNIGIIPVTQGKWIMSVRRHPFAVGGHAPFLVELLFQKKGRIY